MIFVKLSINLICDTQYMTLSEIITNTALWRFSTIYDEFSPSHIKWFLVVKADLPGPSVCGVQRSVRRDFCINTTLWISTPTTASATHWPLWLQGDVILPSSLQSHRLWCSHYNCRGVLEYIRDISILCRLELYPCSTISIEETPYPPNHVHLCIQPHANIVHASITSITQS